MHSSTQTDNMTDTLNRQSIIWKRTPPPVFSGEILENGWLWSAASKQSKRMISKKIFLVELF